MGQQPSMEQIELENAVADIIKALEQNYKEALGMQMLVHSKERRAYWGGVCIAYLNAIRKVKSILER